MSDEIKLEWHNERRKVKDLIAHPNNPRQLTEDQAKVLTKSLEKFNLVEIPAIDTDNTLLAGHQRMKIMLLLGRGEEEIDVRMPNRKLTEEERDSYNILSNKATGEWDWNILANWNQDLLLDSGFTKMELSKGFDLNLKPEEGEDDVPEVDTTAPPIAQLADVWQLGQHRLMCGDATKAEDVFKLLGGNKTNLMVTDPPYGVNYDPEWREDVGLHTDERSLGKVTNDNKVDWSEAYKLFSGNVVYIWHAGVFAQEVAENLDQCGFGIISQIIWAKQHFVLSRGNYHWQHEPCWYAVRRGEKHNWQGARDQATIWEIKNNNAFGNSAKEKTWGHGTQKPLECMLKPILNNSKEGDFIYDPFGGSGTTLMACEKSKRNCLMMEIEPKYCDVIIKRWEEMTGQKAVKLTV